MISEMFLPLSPRIETSAKRIAVHQQDVGVGAFLDDSQRALLVGMTFTAEHKYFSVF